MNHSKCHHSDGPIEIWEIEAALTDHEDFLQMAVSTNCEDWKDLTLEPSFAPNGLLRTWSKFSIQGQNRSERTYSASVITGKIHAFFSEHGAVHVAVYDLEKK